MTYEALGLCYKNLNNSTKAIECFQKALSIKPNQISTLNHLGIIFSHLGQSRKALQYFRKIIDFKPDSHRAHRHMSLVTDYKTDKRHIFELEAILEKNLSPLAEIDIRYAYFKAMSTMRNFDAAFKNLKRAKALRKLELQYDIRRDLKVFDRVKSFYSQKQKLKIFNTKNKCSLKNIFVIGMPRSGTTLIEQILASHSEVAGGGEVPFLGAKLYPIFSPDGEAKPQHIINSTLETLFEDYCKFVSRLRSDSTFFVDKMPSNFLWVGLIREFFPNAKIVNIQREPMAVIWSNYKHFFSSKELSFTNDLKDILSYYRAYVDLMKFWNSYNESEIYTVNYEQLTEQPKEEISKLLKYCKLEWEDSCVDFYKKDSLVKTASRDQVKQPIYRGSSSEWKKYHEYLAPIARKAKSL